MPQNEYMEKHRKEHGRRLDHEERVRKREAREAHTLSAKATNLRGFRAKMFQQERHKHKIQMRKQIKALEEKNVKSAGEKDPSQPLPSYLLDRNNPQQAKSLSSAIKNRRSEKAARYSVPIPKVSVVATGKRKGKGWKRMVTMPTFVVKYERFIRPMGLRYKKCHLTHKELGVTVCVPIISVKKNPQQALYTQLGCLTRGTVIEVNVSELGLTTAGGKVVWGRW
ncbi:ribosomal protein S8e/ribosomal biogenesis NSA2 [Xylaria bambusicola]|uniref:ribosomal protein S8e/ribosomal biogenesis NSA2 n=1 Tax=Xylaria bambusicola TaxID=326684 RepID=UPI0020087322|nr:ribosomal protein S8e/ribosomal biogenesis NSA2 [Xylaria bambusicola]KAI0521363.1 ribosomal protein S8e/ribosomal biogenesis NSA2 [Xylaria bambusicola]